jgi:acyl carrier protein
MPTEVLTKEQIFAELKEYIENDLDFKGVTEEITFEDLGMDSLDVVELVMECEKKYSVSIGDEQIEATCTVSQLANLIYNDKN